MTSILTEENVIKQIREKIDAMIGKKFKYGNGEHLFKKYILYPERERVEIYTDKNVYDRTFDTALSFLDFFKKIDNIHVPVVTKENGHTPSGVIIYQTTDYSKFDFLKGNRKINERKINNIMDEINNGNDILRYSGILVKESYNERLSILDGQHRYHVSKKLKRPVYYIIVEEDKSMPDIAKVNSNVEKWKNSDYIDCFREHGNEHYKTLNNFINKYGISLTVSLQLLNLGTPGKDSGAHPELHTAFKNGYFEVKTLNEGIAMAEECRKFINFSHNASRSFLIAIFKIQKAMLVTIDELVEAYKKRPDMLTQQTSYKNYITVLEQIYNVGKKVRYVII